MAIVRLARHAMATRFEIVLCGSDPVSLRAAGEEALNEIERLEGQLSLFKPTSEIAHLNARASCEPVRVTPPVFRLLQHAQRLTEETKGAFDITVAPLVRCWGFMAGSGKLPAAQELAAARARVGMHLVRLDESSFSVRFERDGVMLDLGAIGKGYAIEQAVELLREAGIVSALIHGGTSTLYAIGHPPQADAWKIEIADPRSAKVPASPGVTSPFDLDAEPARESNPANPFATVLLRDASLSVSAVWGKSFEAQGRTFGHVLDPRSGEPANRAVVAAVALPSATETDALSTALLTVGPEGHDEIARLRPQIRTLVASETSGGLCVRTHGIRAEPGPEM